MVPVRTCIGCRRRSEQNTVVRFVLDRSQKPPRVLLDADRKKPGRGAWLHVESGCFETALKRRAFQRAFRQPVDTEHLTFNDVAHMTGSHESGLEEMNTR